MADTSTERRLGDMVRLLDRMCGTSYRDLSCPHCDRWIGDPDDPDIATVSVEHDLDECCYATADTSERTLRIKYSATGHCAVTHPAAPLGRHGATITHEVTSIPRTVSTADAVRRYAATAILPSYGTTVAYADLGSRILT